MHLNIPAPTTYRYRMGNAGLPPGVLTGSVEGDKEALSSSSHDDESRQGKVP